MEIFTRPEQVKEFIKGMGIQVPLFRIQQNMNRKNTINDLPSDIVQRFAVPHVWIMGDKNLKEYLGGGSPKIFARWRSGTKKGNILKYRLTEKAFMYRTDWVDEFIDKEFSVEEVNLKF